MNSTYFKFNGKFCKQKFGTPIGSAISPILAKIVMEDLEEFVFKKLDFELPFYFRYVGDTILYVPLHKIHILIYSFNSFHPRMQFTYDREINNRKSFYLNSHFSQMWLFQSTDSVYLCVNQ